MFFPIYLFDISKIGDIAFEWIFNYLLVRVYLALLLLLLFWKLKIVNENFLVFMTQHYPFPSFLIFFTSTKHNKNAIKIKSLSELVLDGNYFYLIIDLK